MIQNLLYFKLCLNRANSHIAIPLSLVDKGILLAVLFKVYGVDSLYVVVVCIFLALLAMALLGHADIRYGIMEREVSLNNKYNPEIQKILQK